MGLKVKALHTLSTDFILLNREKRQKCVCHDIEKCWLQKCDLCSNGKGLRKLRDVVKLKSQFGSKSIKYDTWVKADNGHHEKTNKKVKVSKLIDDVVEQSGNFFKHCYVTKCQAKAFNIDRDAAEPQSATLQIDFGENYSCTSQDEVQSAYWNREGVTLFNAVLWHNGNVQSFCVCSDTHHHTKNEILVFTHEI